MRFGKLQVLAVLHFVLIGNSVAQPWEIATECEAQPVVRQTSDGVEFVRTPEACFANLTDFPYQLRTVEIDGLRQGYIDEGSKDAEPVLLLHWSAFLVVPL